MKKVMALSLGELVLKGTKISLGIKQEKINIFDSEGNRNLVKGVVNDYDVYFSSKLLHFLDNKKENNIF